MIYTTDIWSLRLTQIVLTHSQYQLVEKNIMQIMLSVLKGVLAVNVYIHKWKSSGLTQND